MSIFPICRVGTQRGVVLAASWPGGGRGCPGSESARRRGSPEVTRAKRYHPCSAGGAPPECGAACRGFLDDGSLRGIWSSQRSIIMSSRKAPRDLPELSGVISRSWSDCPGLFRGFAACAVERRECGALLKSWRIRRGSDHGHGWSEGYGYRGLASRRRHRRLQLRPRTPAVSACSVPGQAGQQGAGAGAGRWRVVADRERSRPDIGGACLE
jgi:hypothetical protein